jgi:hypothetical protein
MVRKRYEGGYIERDETKTRVTRSIIYGYIYITLL